MKRRIIYSAIAMLFVFGVTEAKAQDRLQFKIGYHPGMPVGSFKDYMGKNSFRGYLGEIAYPVNERLKIGLGVSFNDFYEKIPRKLYQFEEGTVSAVRTNSIQSTPVLLKASYELTKTGWIRPYVGLGAGFNLASYSRYFGEFGDKKTAFKPAAAAEAGINIPFNRETRISGINIGGHFNYLPFKYNELSNLNNWGLHAAVYFPLR
jgi:opacity protein-like surface antigen